MCYKHLASIHGKTWEGILLLIIQSEFSQYYVKKLFPSHLGNCRPLIIAVGGESQSRLHCVRKVPGKSHRCCLNTACGSHIRSSHGLSSTGPGCQAGIGCGKFTQHLFTQTVRGHFLLRHCCVFADNGPFVSVSSGEPFKLQILAQQPDYGTGDFPRVPRPCPWC